ncbi:hypothetical protein BB558_002085 [Smittium angustum]|uniref:CRAL-TRIO domain-containing protein n=1 Tax=Smittium angustum TaxID=133377 RepID=A0A2U1JA04_SMIAN|nr:hypothetical protein BB558_002085 [Smittium angustum]
MAQPIEKTLVQFEKGRIDLKGCYKHLNDFERHRLQELWQMCIERFDTPIESLTGAKNSNISLPNIGVDEKEVSKPPKNPNAKVFMDCIYDQNVSQKVGKKLVPVDFVSTCKDNTLRSQMWESFREDVPDTLALRFLRARNWDVEKALDMILTTIKWRYMDNVEEKIFYGETLNEASLMYKGTSFIHGVDKLGHPIIWSPSAAHFQKDQPFSQMKRYLVWIMETARKFLHYPHEKVCLIMDLSNHSTANMDWPFVKMFLKYLSTFYPECLGVAIVYNGPWFFPAVFKLISPLIDPNVAMKIQFVKNEEGLLKFINKDQLIKIRGGDNNYEYEYIPPNENENIKMANLEEKQIALEKRNIIIDELTELTNKWIEAGNLTKELDSKLDNLTNPKSNNNGNNKNSDDPESDDDIDEITKKLDEAIKNELEIHQLRDECQERFAAAARNLDQYTRARSLYNRIGVLDEDNVDWSKVQKQFM